MARRITSFGAALALGALAPSVARAQAELALADAPAPALKASYHLVLTSTWPQEQVEGCRNGGLETVEGTLTREADGHYSGTLTRRTELLFCGAHGNASAAADSLRCAVRLEGEGRVAMTGLVVDDDGSPSGLSMQATWTPLPSHSAVVTGACAAGFKQALRAMYLSAPHAAEFQLTPVGAGPRTEQLENYAWRVEVR